MAGRRGGRNCHGVELCATRYHSDAMYYYFLPHVPFIHRISTSATGGIFSQSQLYNNTDSLLRKMCRSRQVGNAYLHSKKICFCNQEENAQPILKTFPFLSIGVYRVFLDQHHY